MIISVAFIGPAWSEEIATDVRFKPGTLNTKSKGRWVGCFITPPEGYIAEDIDGATVKIIDIGGVAIPEDALFGDWYIITDPDDLDEPELLVKFRRSAVNEVLLENNLSGQVEFTISGALLDGENTITGIDILKVIAPKGKKPFGIR